MNDMPLSEVVYYWIDRTIRRTREYTKQVFQEEGFGVTIDQWILMKSIHDNQDISQTELAQATFKDPAAVTRTLEILARKGLVQRTARPGDRRAYEISLTQEGQALIDRMIPKVQELRAIGLQGLTAEQIECLRGSLHQIYENVEAKMR